MKRLISVAVQAIGYVIEVVLIVAFASILANRQSSTGTLSQAPQSPLTSPTAPLALYPKPLPVTPPATIAPKPSAPAGLTLTPFPSSPLATPAPYSSPTARYEARLWRNGWLDWNYNHLACKCHVKGTQTTDHIGAQNRIHRGRDCFT